MPDASCRQDDPVGETATQRNANSLVAKVVKTFGGRMDSLKLLASFATRNSNGLPIERLKHKLPIHALHV
jgi:hypothetical protein